MGKHADNPRVERFTLVLTTPERRLLEQLAVHNGLSMSEFVRKRVFVASGDALELRALDPKDPAGMT